MAISKVQQATGTGATITLNGVVAANALSLQESAFDGTLTTALSTPTDSNGTFAVVSAAAGTRASGLGTALVGIWAEKNTASGTHTVTPDARNGYSGCVVEWSGLDTVNLIDGANSAASSAAGGQTSQSTGTSGTTAQAVELVLLALGVVGSPGAA